MWSLNEEKKKTPCREGCLCVFVSIYIYIYMSVHSECFKREILDYCINEKAAFFHDHFQPQILSCIISRFTFMTSCWECKDTSRPSFTEIVIYLSNLLECTAEYLDLTGLKNGTSDIKDTTGGVEDSPWSNSDSLHRTPAASNEYYIATK